MPKPNKPNRIKIDLDPSIAAALAAGPSQAKVQELVYVQYPHAQIPTVPEQSSSLLIGKAGANG